MILSKISSLRSWWAQLGMQRGRIRAHHHIVRYILTRSEGKASKRGGIFKYQMWERQEDAKLSNYWMTKL